MDSYSYNSYARYYDKNFPTDFQRRCNETASLREDYQSFFNQRHPLVETNVSETNVSETNVSEPNVSETNVSDSKDGSDVNLSLKVD